MKSKGSRVSCLFEREGSGVSWQVGRKMKNGALFAGTSALHWYSYILRIPPFYPSLPLVHPLFPPIFLGRTRTEMGLWKIVVGF